MRKRGIFFKAFISKAFIARYAKKIEQVKIDLPHVNAVVKLYQFDDERPQFPAHMGISRLFKRGEVLAICLEVLRISKTPLDTSELAAAVIEAEGLFKHDEVLMRC